jgi:hypothetical protein
MMDKVQKLSNSESRILLIFYKNQVLKSHVGTTTFLANVFMIPKLLSEHDITELIQESIDYIIESAICICN